MPTWKESDELDIGYRGKMFVQPVVQYTLEQIIPDGGSPDENEVIRAAYETQWDAGMTKLKRKREALIKKAMDDTEKAIDKLPAEEADDKKRSIDIDSIITKANNQIQQGLDDFRKFAIKRLAEDCISKAYDEADKALKKNVIRQKIKTELKLVPRRLIKLATAASSTAASDRSEDVLDVKEIASIIAVVRMIDTGAGAIGPSVKTIRDKYVSYCDFMEKVKTDVSKLDEAVDHQKKKATKDDWRKLSPKEKANLVKNTCGPIMTALNSQIKEAEKDIIVLRNEFRKAQLALDNMTAALKKQASLGDFGIKENFEMTSHEVKRADAALETLEDNLLAFNDLKAEVELLIGNLEKNGEFDSKKVSTIGRLAARAEGKGVIILFVEAACMLPMLAGKLSKAADKLSKAAGR